MKIKEFFQSGLGITLAIIASLGILAVVGYNFWGWFGGSDKWKAEHPDTSLHIQGGGSGAGGSGGATGGTGNTGGRMANNSGVKFVSSNLSKEEIQIVNDFASKLRQINSMNISQSEKETQANSLMNNANERLKDMGLEPGISSPSATAKQNCGCALCWEIHIILDFYCCRRKCCND